MCLRHDLGYVKYNRRFLKQEHIDFIKERLKPKYTHCSICGKVSKNKYCSKQCLKEFHRRNHYLQKIPCKICGKITHKKYCCDVHKKQGLKKTRKGIAL